MILALKDLFKTIFFKPIKNIMKKIIAFSMVLLPSLALAQFTKGQVYLGGSLSASFYSNDISSPSVISKVNTFSLLPVVGIFLNEKISVGGGIGYTTSYTEYQFNPGFQKNTNKGISVSSIARYYVPISPSFYFAANGQITFTRANQKSVQNDGSQESTQDQPNYTIGVALKPVFIFFPSKNWGIEATVGSLGYNYQRYLPDVTSNNTISFNLGSFSFGLAYYFTRK